MPHSISSDSPLLHTQGGAITGDPAGLARSTQTEEGVNNYTIILSNTLDLQRQTETEIEMVNLQ